MKWFGAGIRPTADGSELEGVTLVSTPTELRRLADFLRHCADAIEADPLWEHEHFKDWIDTQIGTQEPDFEIWNSER